MSESVTPSTAETVNRLHRVEMRQIKAEWRVVDTLRNARAAMGRAIAAGIGDQPLKAFGHAGLVSGVTSGAKVPDYLARLYRDVEARKRLALALLDGVPRVTVNTVINVEQESA